MKEKITTYILKNSIYKLALMLFIFLTGFSVLSQKTNLSGDDSNQSFMVESQSNNNILINYVTPSIQITDKLIDGEIFQNIQIPGHFLPGNAGAPNLPASGRYIAIPAGSTPILNILSFHKEIIDNINLAPSFRIPKETENGPLDYVKDPSIYASNAFYPESPFQLSKQEKIRGVDVVMLGITPFQYNPVTKQLIIYHHVKIEVRFDGGSGMFGDNRLRSRWWDPVLSDALLNYHSLPEINYDHNFNKDETGCEYLIITPNDIAFQIWADSIRTFRNKQGILTDVVTLSEIGGNSADDIKLYINNAYNTWDIPPAACLMLGDYGTDPANRVLSGIWENYCVSDNIFGDIDDNNLPDIIMARMTARDEAELGILVSKFVNYEKSPPVYEDFYNHPITSTGWQTDSWYQLCAEVIGGYWREALGKDPVRINEISSGTPGTIWSNAENTEAMVAYFGPEGLGYIPEDPSTLGGWTGGNASAINTAIENGAFMIQHRNHGSEMGWAHPEYLISNITSLLTTDLTFVWSTNCLTGKFNYGSEVFAEKMHRYTHKEENSGCFGINAASEITYTFVSDIFVWGAYDYMWPDFMPDFGATPEPRGIIPAIANVSGKYMLEQSNWPYTQNSKNATYHLFHHHGDAFSTVYSEIPQELTVLHNGVLYMGETSYAVTADDGALIGLSVNGELIGTGTGTGLPVSITIPVQAPPDKLMVTVTKQNYFRYEAVVDVLPASGPYVVYNNIELNDASGNGNGIMETAETILANVAVKNVGIEDAQDVEVTLISEDSFITITDNTENYGSIPAGNIATIADAFSWIVADDIPDMHVVEFDLNISDGSDSWNSGFNITGHAPQLETGTMLIDDYVGNWNGRLDPGETAFIIIPTFNNGSYTASSTTGMLTTSSEHITLNNNTFNFYDIGPGLMEEGMFEVSISDDAPAGTYVELIYEVNSGAYQLEHFYSTIISPLVEDWETGDMSQFSWETGGDSNWEVSTINPFEGSFCIKTGPLEDEQTNYLSLPFEAYEEDSISFWCSISSELGYDFLKFYIDDVELKAWSGEVAWERVSFFLSQGSHVLKWEYSKDESNASGEDCAWVDFIVFPIFDFTAAFTSDVTDICEGGSIQFYDVSQIEPESREWTFEGGSPETSTEQNPTIEYFSAGSFDVSLTISDGSNSNTLLLEDYISVIATPDSPPAPTGPETVCASSFYSIYNTSGITGITEYSWVLEPTEAGAPDGTGLEIAVNWELNYLGEATLKVAGLNECGIGVFSEEITITRYLPEVTLEPFETVCVNWPAFELTGGMPLGGEYSGTGVDNGWFDPAEADIGTHTIVYTYADDNNCENFAEETIYVDPCPGFNELLPELKVNVYPNPTSGLLTLHFGLDIGKVEIIIINTLNKIVYSEMTNTHKDQNLDIDLSGFGKGIYYINIRSENKEDMMKIIVN